VSAPLRAALRRHAHEVLIAGGGVALTGGIVAAAAGDLAAALADVLPGRGRIGIWLPAGAAQGTAIAAVLAIDQVAVPLDPWLPPAELARRAESLHALVVPDGAEPPAGCALLWVDRDAGVLGVRPAAAEPPPPPAPEAALVLYTSGSSGAPKAVALPARGLRAVIDDLVARFALDRGTVAAVTLPLHHTMALNTQFLPALLAGGRSVVLDGGLGLRRTYRDLLESRATFVALVSEMLRTCLREREERGLPAAEEVTEVQLSGGPVLAEHLELARRLFPCARLHKGYGLTEAIRVAMIASDHPRFFEAAAGFPLPGQEVAVRDRRGRDLIPGARGEIWVRGPNVMLGYEGERAQPLRDGFLATGDLGALTPDGRLLVEGRRDGVFKSYGRRVAAAEIERAALGCPELAAASCIPVPCPVRGMRPILFVEPEGGDLERFLAAGDPRPAVEASLKRGLPPYKVPREIVFLAALPRSATGKVSHRALAELWREGPPVVDLGRGPLGCRFKRL
jgi:acyl-CoA synthetase (AMP-forming)/AMP-acid ligase II